jgi:DNA replication protein DnaC
MNAPKPKLDIDTTRERLVALGCSHAAVTYRYGRGAILITTNKSVRDWTELLAGDEELAAAILDRLLHRAHVLNIKGRSYRLRDLEDALKLSHA